MSKARSHRPAQTSPAERRNDLYFLIAGVLVVTVMGGLGVALRTRNAAAPPGPSAPAAVEAPLNAPLPVMSQAAPASTGPQVRGNATGVPAASFKGGARLVADYSRLDFGAKDYEEMVNGEFTVSNVGDAPLTIEDVSVRTIVGC